MKKGELKSMPTIEVNKKDLEKLVGKKFSKSELEEALMFVKGEIDAEENGLLKIDVKETNRPELWSTEGIAREIRSRIGLEKGLKKYSVKKARVTCTIEKSVEQSRPLIACAIVRNVKVSDEFIRQVVQLQEKIGTTFGRKRKEAGIGLYDYDIMSPPIFYRGYEDDEIEFVPLGYKVKMKPSEVLVEHPKGKEFGHLLSGVKKYPIVIDSKNVVASMPPIINSETTGKITEKTRNIFVEATGFNWEIVHTTLKVMCMALADRGGEIEAVKIVFPKGKPYPKESIETPCFKTKKMELDLEYLRKISGINFDAKQAIELILKSGMNAVQKKGKIIVEYPDYRLDVLHPIDIVEDILISYGYNSIKPETPRMSVTGEEKKETIYMDLVRDVCVGLGLQEVLTFNLTSKEKQEELIGLKDEEFVEIANPVSSKWSILRKRIYPELLDFLSKNKHAEYPQKIFEIGKTIEVKENEDNGVLEKTKLCVLIAGKNYGFTNIKSVLQAICSELELKFEISEANYPVLKKGKAGAISGDITGLIGEISEETLKKIGVEQPIVMLEIELNFKMN